MARGAIQQRLQHAQFKRERPVAHNVVQHALRYGKAVPLLPVNRVPCDKPSTMGMTTPCMLLEGNSCMQGVGDLDGGCIGACRGGGRAHGEQACAVQGRGAHRQGNMNARLARTSADTASVRNRMSGPRGVSVARCGESIPAGRGWNSDTSRGSSPSDSAVSLLSLTVPSGRNSTTLHARALRRCAARRRCWNAVRSPDTRLYVRHCAGRQRAWSVKAACSFSCSSRRVCRWLW